MSASYGTLVNSLNLFVDTSDPTHKGDDINLLITPPLHIGEIPGASYKIALTEFSMHRPTFTIDANNNSFSFRTLAAGGGAAYAAAVDVEMVVGNKRDVFAIATAFAEALRLALVDEGFVIAAADVVVASPIEFEREESTGNMLLSVSLNVAAGHGLGDLLVQFYDTSDAYILLGGDRVGVGSELSSLVVDVTNPNQIVITGRYPMQLTSLKHVYLRTDLQNTSIQVGVSKRSRPADPSAYHEQQYPGEDSYGIR